MCLLGKAGGTRLGPQPRGAHMHTAPGGSQRALGVDTLGGQTNEWQEHQGRPGGAQSPHYRGCDPRAVKSH